jgi:4-carboxymuconolactone decarboxylase
VEQALRIANDVFRSQGMTLPLPSQTTVQDDERFAKGLAAQKAIFGDSIDAMHAHATEDQRPLVVQHLSAFCFGDIYTRNGLSVQDRELIVFCLLSVLGGCEPQLKGHIAGNAAVGNDRAVLLDALAQCLPYMGFPRTLNALTCINAVLPPAEKK